MLLDSVREDVRQVQIALERAGFDPGWIDGTFGTETEAAVLRFQKSRDLHADGLVGPQTWAALTPLLEEEFWTDSRAIGTGKVLVLHGASVSSVSFSPNEGLVATASDDGTARVWDLEGREVIRCTHDSKVSWVAFSPNGRLIATASADRTARLWDRAGNLWGVTGKELARCEHDANVSCVAFDPDGQLIATASADRTVRLWDLEGKELARLAHKGRVRHVAFDPDGQLIATASADGSARLWTPAGKKLARCEHDANINWVTFSSNGRLIATASNDGTARLWDLEGKELARLAHKGRVRHVAFDPDGRLIATASDDGAARLWDLEGKELARFEHRSKVVHVAFDPDGRLIATASDDGAARLWDLEGKELARFEHRGEVRYVAFRRDGQLVATASADGSARLWPVMPAGRPKLDALLAGFAPDTLAGEDRLGIQNDVNVLCSVLAAREVQPPLSVGLFGEWGSGKSFFMGLMKRRIEQIAEESSAAEARGEATLYCSRVRQITFNAWHYADGNLWANLVTHIFDRLADPEGGFGTRWSAAEQANLVGELRLVKEERRQVEARVGALTKEKEAIQQGLSELEKERRKIEQDAKRVRTDLSRVAESVRATGVVKEKVSEFRSALGPDARADLEDATRLVRAATSLWGATRQTLRLLGPGRRRRVRMLLLATLAAMFVLPALVFEFLEHSAELRVLAAGAGFLLPALLSTTRGLLWLNGAVGRAEAATSEAEREAEKRREELEGEAAELNRHLDSVQAKEVELTREVQLKGAEVERVTQELADVSAGRGLSRFIQQRSASADYRQHLGIVALIRQDFETLIDLLGEQHESVGVPRIDRIVLYIDDLDRCPPDRVVEVLQAVHLLLAIPLFVVVVGVDPRWLLRSLEHHYAALLAELRPGVPGDIPERQRLLSDRDLADWRSTPAHYLEKIFQIPYALPGMRAEGFRVLIRDLVSVAPTDKTPLDGSDAGGEKGRDDIAPEVSSTTTAPELLPTPKADGGFDVAHVPAEAVGGVGDSTESLAGESVAVPLDGEIRDRSGHLGGVDLVPRALLLTDAEVTFMGHLAPMIKNPREAKRLANVYRLLKASIPRSALGDFEMYGHQAALTLIGAVIAFPDSAGPLFRDILAGGRDDSWRAFVEALRVDDRGDDGFSDKGTVPPGELHRALTALLPHFTLPDRLEPFRDLIPLVARYSFRQALDVEARGVRPAKGQGAATVDLPLEGGELLEEPLEV